MLTLLNTSYFTNPEYITQFTYGTFAVLTGLASSIKMDEFFISYYGLTAGIVMDEEGNPVSVFFFDSVFYANLYLFSQTDKYICSGPCSILTFPE